MTEGTADQKLKVFISYSRQDLAFADELVAGLDLFGEFDIRIERDAIHEGEDWRARLGALIAEADTIVFILSPKSAASPICQWEVEEAERLSKRIVPVQSAPLEGIKPPTQLASLNYVRFDPDEAGRPRSYAAGLGGLRRALNTDLGWLREHTRLLMRAQEWTAAGKAENRLLLGSDISDAKEWLEAKPKDAPPPTELHHDFVAASEQAENARLSKERKRAEALQSAVTRTRVALFGAIALAFVAGLTGWYAWQQQKVATQQAKRADNQATIAKSAAAESRRERDATLLTQSRYLAGISQENRRNGDIGNAIALARRALPSNLTAPIALSNQLQCRHYSVQPPWAAPRFSNSV